jgi:hypothetical protein
VEEAGGSGVKVADVVLEGVGPVRASVEEENKGELEIGRLAESVVLVENEG